MSFLKTKAGVLTLCVVLLFISFITYRVVSRRSARAETAAVPTPTQTGKSAPAAKAQGGAAKKTGGSVDPTLSADVSAMRSYYKGANPVSSRDITGNPQALRQTAGTPQGAGVASTQEFPTAAPKPKVTLRLGSHKSEARRETPAPTVLQRGQDLYDAGATQLLDRLGKAKAAATAVPVPASTEALARVFPTSGTPGAAKTKKPTRFVPYGRPIKCELVFTLDSTAENTPLVAIVVEPVYNNGRLVIPANTELHGTARPDRLRERIFSGTEWYMVFPREHTRPNGRQLHVKGVALDRDEPEATGVTWGITDGSFGLRGHVIRTAEEQELKLFASTFIAAASQALQTRSTNANGQELVNNTPRNAALEGVSANLNQVARTLREEIEKHGVFIRVPAGKQFYFYPQLTIDPDAADISHNIAGVE